MKITIGNSAQKERFYRRDNIRNRILDSIKNGENLLLSAPRRIGKSSILLDLIDRPDGDVYAVFVNTEDIEDSEKFFEMVLNALLDVDLIEGFGGFAKGAKETFKRYANMFSEVKLGPIGLKGKEHDGDHFYKQFVSFLEDVKLEGKIILMLVDEFPITLERIVTKDGVNAGINFLSQNRSLRQNPRFNQKIKFEIGRAHV